MSMAALRRRRFVQAAVDEGGGGDGGGGSPGSSGGRGTNWPGWTDTTTYPEQTFASDIPAHPTLDASGFKWYDGGGDTGDWGNASYPTVDTPIGNKRVLRIRYPGSTTNITAADQTTPVRALGGFGTYGVGIRVSGTWSGTLEFERSDDGMTGWVAHTVLNPATYAPLSASTTGNGTFWAEHSPNAFFRVRASSLVSGTAVVQVGMEGGSAPFRFAAGEITAGHTRVYHRLMLRMLPGFTTNGNTGVKLFFFRQADGDNHYINLGGDGGISTSITLQPQRSDPVIASEVVPLGEWADLEFELIANTPGVGDGVGRIFLNGTLVGERTDIMYFDTGDAVAFGAFADPTYGGGYNPPPDNIYFDIAFWYRESAA